MCEADTVCQIQAVHGIGCLMRVIAQQHQREKTQHVVFGSLTRKNMV